MKLLVTGGAGFIGSAFVRLSLRDSSIRIANLDKLTYAGNLANLEPIAANPRYRFAHGDICDAGLVNSLIAEERPDAIVHFAAESGTDESCRMLRMFVAVTLEPGIQVATCDQG